MVAGFQRDVGRSAADPLAGVLYGNFEGGDFRVVNQVVLVPSLANDLTRAVQDHAAHSRVRRAYGDPAARQLNGSLHPVTVLVLETQYLSSLYRIVANESQKSVRNARPSKSIATLNRQYQDRRKKGTKHR